MQLTINTETKTIIIQSGETVSLKELFNFVHSIDADNADEWKIVNYKQSCHCTNPFNVPYVSPIQPITGPYTLTCEIGPNTDITGINGENILTSREQSNNTIQAQA